MKILNDILLSFAIASCITTAMLFSPIIIGYAIIKNLINNKERIKM